MKALISLGVAYYFLERSLNYVTGKKRSLEGFALKVLSLTVNESFRHLLPKTAEKSKQLSFSSEPHQ